MKFKYAKLLAGLSLASTCLIIFIYNPKNMTYMTHSKSPQVYTERVVKNASIIQRIKDKFGALYFDKLFKDNLNLTLEPNNETTKTHLPSELSDFEETQKIILWFDKPFLAPDVTWFGGAMGEEPFADCPESRCTVTTNKQEVETSHAIVFPIYITNFLKLPFPKHRSPHQKWLFFNAESPANIPFVPIPPGTYNMSMSYESYADVQLDIKQVVQCSQQSLPSLARMPRFTQEDGKARKMVAWAVSHCQTCGQREDYAVQLRKHIEVDIYGKCTPLKCDDFKSYYQDSGCFQMINTTYLFYLSFENSYCQDYVTEKLWRTLYLDVVPVVYGKTNYTKILPPNSFIDVHDFKGPQELANFLHELSQDKERYMKYFEWRKTHCVTAALPMQCKLCQVLHEKKNIQQTVDFENFFNVEKVCEDPFWNISSPQRYFTMKEMNNQRHIKNYRFTRGCRKKKFDRF